MLEEAGKSHLAQQIRQNMTSPGTGEIQRVVCDQSDKGGITVCGSSDMKNVQSPYQDIERKAMDKEVPYSSTVDHLTADDCNPNLTPGTSLGRNVSSVPNQPKQHQSNTSTVHTNFSQGASVGQTSKAWHTNQKPSKGADPHGFHAINPAGLEASKSSSGMCVGVHTHAHLWDQEFNSFHICFL